MPKMMVSAEILSNKELCPGIRDLTLSAPEISNAAVPGQFVNVYLNDPSRILPRPISLCHADRENGTIRLVFRVTGSGTGTELLSAMEPGEHLDVLGPLGNGFPSECQGEGPVFLVGGGIGLPPMLGVLKGSFPSAYAVLGYRDSNTFLLDDFLEAAEEGHVLTASEDGSTGVRGFVTDAVAEAEQKGIVPSVMMACGPKPMLKALRDYAKSRGIPLWISMEERMACGIGVCLGCVTGSTEKDGHSNVNNKRVCKDGPVFSAEEVVL